MAFVAIAMLLGSVTNVAIILLQTYLGIQIFRFYFKCTKCSAELAMKTDPQNSDYVVEAGATRNFEPWRNEDEVKEGKHSAYIYMFYVFGFPSTVVDITQLIYVILFSGSR